MWFWLLHFVSNGGLGSEVAAGWSEWTVLDMNSWWC